MIILITFKVMVEMTLQDRNFFDKMGFTHPSYESSADTKTTKNKSTSARFEEAMATSLLLGAACE